MSIIQPDELDKLVFVDESASNAAMAPRYARAPRSQRAVGKRPRNETRRTVTMLGGLSSKGLTALMTVEGGTTGAVFCTFVQRVLVPSLEPGQVVVMDNLAAHKVAGVADAIEAAGCSLLYLPPYSPDFNPIELCWNKVKHLLRKAMPRTKDAINTALGKIIKLITPNDALAWFRHFGYGEMRGQPH